MRTAPKVLLLRTLPVIRKRPGRTRVSWKGTRLPKLLRTTRHVLLLRKLRLRYEEWKHRRLHFEWKRMQGQLPACHALLLQREARIVLRFRWRLVPDERRGMQKSMQKREAFLLWQILLWAPMTASLSTVILLTVPATAIIVILTRSVLTIAASLLCLWTQVDKCSRCRNWRLGRRIIFWIRNLFLISINSLSEQIFAILSWL